MDSNSSSYSHHSNGSTKEMPKDIQKKAQTVGTNIQKISQNVSSMKKMVNLLGTAQDSQDLRQQLHQIQHYTNNLAKDTSSNLKELTLIQAPLSQADQREWKMQKERLAEEFTIALNAFQEAQRRACQKERDEVRRTRANSHLPPPPVKYNADIFGDGRFADQLIELQDNSGGRLTQAQIQEEESNLRMVQEQEQSIRQLEKDISDVNQIFKELGSMVHEQGEIVDSIEASVEKTEVMVSDGAAQLRQASTYSNKLRKKKCILASCLAIVLLLMIFVISSQSS